jgi:mRNA interferase MazF
LIKTSVVIEADTNNGLSKTSVADCLQTRPIDKNQRILSIRGILSKTNILEIDEALKIVFDLDK